MVTPLLPGASPHLTPPRREHSGRYPTWKRLRGRPLGGRPRTSETTHPKELQILSIRDLSVDIAGKSILRHLSLSVAPGESVAVMGPSGTGKTTLLSAVMGIIEPRSGSILVAGHSMTGISVDARAQLRRDHMGLIFQNADLLPELNVAENVALTLLFDGMARPAALSLAEDALGAVGVAGLGERRTDEISGGQAQRVALARALVRPGTTVIVADEPTASLDQTNAHRVTDLMLASIRERGAACMLATHDPSIASRCDRTVHLGAEAVSP